MVTIKPLTEQKAKGTNRKPKSGVAYPYYDLSSSIKVAEVIHSKAGGGCTRDQLAQLLGYSGIKNGGFLTRLSASKMFGLVDEDSRGLRITKRAQQILSPVMPDDSKRGKADSFLSVELFKKVYEKFKGQTLPADSGLRNLFQTTYQIVPDRIAPALRVLKESADTAGFLSPNHDRLVMPLFGNNPTAASSAPERSLNNEIKPDNDRRVAKDENLDEIDPAIYGLIRRLPTVGTSMSKKKRDDLVGAFTALITFLYPEEEVNQ